MTNKYNKPELEIIIINDDVIVTSDGTNREEENKEKLTDSLNSQGPVQ